VWPKPVYNVCVEVMELPEKPLGPNKTREREREREIERERKREKYPNKHNSNMGV